MMKLLAVTALLLGSILSAYPSSVIFSSYSAETSRTGSKPLKWKSDQIKIEISTSLFEESSNIRSEGDILEAIKRSFSTWSEAAGITFDLVISDKQKISNSGERGDGINLLTIARSVENLAPFNGDNFNSAGATRVFFDRNGNISEVDIALNPNQFFSTNGTFSTFDLESTLTHEIGHMLGLGHSMVIGSTMYPNQGQNGVFSVTSTVQRTLSLTDIHSLKTLYPEIFYAEDCCGTVSGVIKNTLNRKDLGPVIWIEEFESGRTVTAAMVEKDGRYEISGLVPGQYRILLGVSDGPNNGISLFDESEFQITADEMVRIDGTIQNDFLLQSERLFGLNGQLSAIALPINSGESQSIFISGTDILKEPLEMLSTSPHLILTPGNIVISGDQRYHSVLSFGVEASSSILPGNYSIYLWSKDRSPRVFLGAIAVR